MNLWKAFLRGLASAGGGEYHFAANPQTIPDIFDGSLTVRHVRRNVPNPNPPEFTNLFDLQVVPDPSEPMTIEVRDTDLDPRCVWVSTVSLYLRRAGLLFPWEYVAFVDEPKDRLCAYFGRDRDRFY